MWLNRSSLLMRCHLLSLLLSSWATRVAPSSLLPVLDGRGLDSAEGTPEHDHFVATLLHAASEVGFFYITNTSVTENTMAGTLQAAQRFFAMPMETKEALSYESSPAFRGYMRVGVENTGGLTDLREQVEFGPEGPEKMKKRRNGGGDYNNSGDDVEGGGGRRR